LHATTLIFLINPRFNNAQLGVSAITCPGVTSAGFSIGGCTKKIIDTAGADRQWVTSEGSHVYISYHDSRNSSLIHVQRSDDDGFTWTRVGDPIVGQDGVTANATFNNIQGPIVADPVTHNVYDIFAAGETGFLKGRTFTPNHIYVSRSTDGGKSWTANLVFQAAPGTSLAAVFPSLAVDPTNGKLYAVWSDAHTVWFSESSDRGSHWSSAVAVNIAPADTAVFPWVAAYNGTADVVYYGTTASNKDDPSAVWNVYLAQTTNDGASFAQSVVSNTANHVGVICTNGTGCAAGTRNLLDLFEVAIDPLNGKAGVIYTDDTLTMDSNGNPLPQLVLAQQK
jgi:BNR repeat-like domain